MSQKLDPSKPYSDAEKLWLHEWSLDHLIEENERRFAQSDVHDKGEPVDVKGALEKAGVEVLDPPPQPTYVGAMGTVQQGPLIVEGEDNSGRVPMPRDHPLTGVVDDTPEDVATDGEWDSKKVKAELNELTVPELQDELREAGEPVSGNKDELVKRLYARLKKDHDESK